MTFYDRYAECCRRNGIEPGSESTAQQIGCSRANISIFKKKGNTPNGDIVAGAAQLLNVSADYLLGLIDTPHPLKIDNDEKDFSENEIELITAYRNHSEMQTAVNTLLGINSDSADEADKNVYQIKKAAHNGSQKATIADSKNNLVEIPYVARSETGERGKIVKTQEEIDEFLKNLNPDTSGQY